MGKVVCITKDGLLSIAGMLIEDLSLNHAQIDSLGNLYVRMLIEDPAFPKVKWGRDGVIRCRSFWEGVLWHPKLETPPWKSIYIPANSSTWINSDISFPLNFDLQIFMLGRASYGTEGPPINGIPDTDADGNRYFNGRYYVPKYDPNAVLPSAPVGAAIAKIGTGQAFFVGSEIILSRSLGTGILSFLYNDEIGQYNNNAKEYLALIYQEV